jgi:hypothetical protein
MRNGDRPGDPAAMGNDEDPVVAFLFGRAADSAAPPPAERLDGASSRSISRLRNNRGALYLPTLGTPQRMVRQW